jgi:hypothetical protein
MLMLNKWLAESGYLHWEEVQCHLPLLWLSSPRISPFQFWLQLCLCKCMHYCFAADSLHLCSIHKFHHHSSQLHDHLTAFKLMELFLWNQVLGQTAYYLAQVGLNGYLATVSNLKHPVHKWHCGGAPITVCLTYLQLSILGIILLYLELVRNLFSSTVQ